MSNSVERSHAWSHLVLFLMLFMVALAVMHFSTPTGLAAGNQSIASSGPADLKPFLTAVGLLMSMIIAAVIVVGANLMNRQPIAQAKPKIEAPRKKADASPEQQSRSIEEINRELARIRKSLGR